MTGPSESARPYSMPDLPVKNPGGRPHSIIADAETLAILEKLGELNCTQVEAAAWFGCSEKTVFTLLKENDAARDAFERGRNILKTSLRRRQRERFLEGSDTMLIWMGKQLLGQKDKMEQSGDPEAPVRHVVEYIVTDPVAGGDGEVPNPEGFHER